MATFEEDFRTLVLASATSQVDGRVSWGELPAARERPLVALWDITGEGGYTMDGPDGLDTRMIQVDCWADSFIGARDLADAIRSGLDAYAGTTGGTSFQGIFFRGRRSSNEPGGSAAGAPAQRFSLVSVDVEVWSSDS